MTENIEEELNKLNTDFTNNQSEIDRLSNENKNLKASIDVLTKKVTEVNKVSDPYNQLLEKIRIEKEDLAAIAKKKTPMVNAELDDITKNNISKKIKTINDDVGKLETEEQELIGNIKKITKNIEDAKKDIADKNIAFDKIKQSQRDPEEDLKLLKELKTNLQKEENTKILFFYLDYFGKIEDKKYDPSEKLKTDMYRAQKELEDAKKLLNTKEEELKQAQAKLEAKKKEKNSKIASRSADIISKIK